MLSKFFLSTTRNLDKFLAEEVGFEPTKPFKDLAVFKTTGINHYPTPPYHKIITGYAIIEAMQEDSIFTKIIKGEVPAYKLYEDELTIAILTIQPVQPGHTLVISKKQINQFLDLPDEDYRAVWETVRKIGLHIRKLTGKERLGVVVKGIDVPHAHIHLIPFNPGESLKSEGEVPPARDEELKKMHQLLKLP